MFILYEVFRQHHIQLLILQFLITSLSDGKLYVNFGDTSCFLITWVFITLF